MNERENVCPIFQDLPNCLIKTTDNVLSFFLSLWLNVRVGKIFFANVIPMTSERKKWWWFIIIRNERPISNIEREREREIFLLSLSHSMMREYRSRLVRISLMRVENLIKLAPASNWFFFDPIFIDLSCSFLRRINSSKEQQPKKKFFFSSLLPPPSPFLFFVESNYQWDKAKRWCLLILISTRK